MMTNYGIYYVLYNVNQTICIQISPYICKKAAIVLVLASVVIQFSKSSIGESYIRILEILVFDFRSLRFGFEP